MPSTSPISGWTIPLDSDPLANAALAVRNLVDSIEAGWTAYTPAWTASTTNPVLGNGTLLGWFKQIGKTTLYRIDLTLGSTTTRGAGTYNFSLPFTPRFNPTPIGNCYMRDSSAAANTFRIPLISVSNTINLYDFANPAGAVTEAVPWLWAQSDRIVIAGAYEAA